MMSCQFVALPILYSSAMTSPLGSMLRRAYQPFIGADAARRTRNALSTALLSLLPALAFGQTSLTVYGVMDAGLVLESGAPAGRTLRLTSGVDSGSRLGIMGSEALGRTSSVSFVLERGLNLDTGAAGQGGLMFGRQAYLSLNGSAGQLSLGRQYTPYFKVARDIADPFMLGMAGNANNILAANARLPHALAYRTPAMSNLEGEVMYQAADTGSASGSSTSVALRYQRARWGVALAEHQQSDAGTGYRARYRMLAGQYRAAHLTVQGALVHNQPATDQRSSDLLLGAGSVYGVHQYLLSYISHHDATPARRHARQIAFGYLYRISPRSNLYSAYAHLLNRRNAGFQVGNSTEAGSGSSGLNLGFETAF